MWPKSELQKGRSDSPGQYKHETINQLMNGIFKNPHSKKCQVYIHICVCVFCWALTVGEVESENKPIYEYTGNVLLQRDKTIPSLQNVFFFLSFMKTRGYHGPHIDSLTGTNKDKAIPIQA